MIVACCSIVSPLDGVDSKKTEEALGAKVDFKRTGKSEPDWTTAGLSPPNLSGKQVKKPKMEAKIQMETTKIFWRVVGPSSKVRIGATRVELDGNWKVKQKVSQVSR